jgi:hypothetical protein
MGGLSSVFQLCLWSGAGNPNRRGRSSSVDLLVLTSLDQLVLMLLKYFCFLTKRVILTRGVNCTEPSKGSLQLPYPGYKKSKL